MIKLNVHHVLSVRMTPCKAETDAEWRDPQPEKRFMLFRIRKELPGGFGRERRSTPEAYISAQWNPSRWFVFDRKVFRKACVTIKSVGGKYPEETHEYYDTDDAAEKRVREIAEDFPHITVSDDI